ncbi:hypothetical protein [Streptomyces sp. Caat 7-52]|uniref:effector-associated constant component EACC1 n=1 Tax=Streptomyces sp. Caat 7-52 TaxID=2949637 RepID=UPI002035FB1B|nr:hypothetical protein [Streptomyces sp. Caat 7-52]
MRTVLTVQAAGRPDGVEELRGWLLNEPELRGRIVRQRPTAEPPGAMGPATDALVALLEPGGVAAVFAGAVVAWVQSRRGDHTVSITRADGTTIEISTRQTRNLSPQELADLAERLAGPSGGENGGGHAEPPGEERWQGSRPSAHRGPGSRSPGGTAEGRGDRRPGGTGGGDLSS